MNRRNKDSAEPENTKRAQVEDIEVEEELSDEAQEECEPQEQPQEEPEKNPLEEALEKQKDSYLRLAAEYDNFRKRTVREKEALSSDIKSDCIVALLPVIDNLERAAAAQNASAEDMFKGIEMIMTQAAQIFDKMGVTAFCEPGDKFDPQLHNCIGMVESDEYESETIAMVLQRGYMMGDRVIRPAMVQVAQ